MFWFTFITVMSNTWERYTGFVTVQANTVQDAWQNAKNRAAVREMKHSYGPFISLAEALNVETDFGGRFNASQNKQL